MTSKMKKPASPTAVAPPSDEAATLSGRYEDLAALSLENFAVMLRANAALGEGLDAMGKEVMGYARASFESAAAAAAALLGARTLDDVVQLNTDFAKLGMARLIERSARLSEIGVKAANETLAPLGTRIEAAFQQLGKPPAF